MKLSPLDIRKQDFTRRLRGYDPEEVQAFLHTLSAQWDSVLEDTRRQEERVRDLENKLRHYERVEEALQEALQTARESARQAMQAAEQKAQQIRHVAENDAERIKRDAEQERMRMRQETQAIHGRRKEIVARLRAFLISEMEMLAHFEGEDPIGFIKLMPSEQRRLAAMEEAEDASFDEEEASPQAPPAESEAQPNPETTGFSAFSVSESQADEAPLDAVDAETEQAAEPEPDEAPYSWAPPSSEPAEQDTGLEDETIPVPEAAAEESMVDRFLRFDQEQELGSTEPPPSSDVWTASAGEEEARTAPDASEQESAPAEGEESSDRPGWRQKSLIGLGSAHPQPRTPSETVSAAEEEIARIRRILSQLD